MAWVSVNTTEREIKTTKTIEPINLGLNLFIIGILKYAK